jgi:hypothetical protein
MLLSIVLVLFSSDAGASISCEPLYRQAYVRAQVNQSPSEAAEIYLMNFDFQNGVQETFLEAEPLFQLLGTPADRKAEVLSALNAKMKSGELCPLGRVLGFRETAAVLSSSSF